MPKTTQKDHRQNLDIGGAMNQVSPVMYWYRAGHFKNDDEAQGAFKLAHQQGLDGMGKSIREWMGMTEEEYSTWYGKDILPVRNPPNSRIAALSSPGTTFKAWLKQFEDEDSIFGDLAAAVKSDQSFPILKTSLEPALSHLSFKGADRRVKEILREAWTEFCTDTKLADTTSASCYAEYFEVEE